MDMGGSSSSSSGMTMMTPWLHFAAGDYLIFEAWKPSSKGAVAGACIGLLVFAMLERWIAAFRGIMETRWRMEALAMVANQPGVVPLDSSPTSASDGKSDDGEVEVELRYGPRGASSDEKGSTQSVPPRTRTIAPFIPRHDFSRGTLYAVQALIGYALMLCVMTFQAGYIISIICGLGIGEVLFGRLGAQRHAH
ncbi:copper transporter [Gloeophyllum trabeum ATCC 11539]|uniref:Copper transport protein n=1 Tax=Gloeophyllum trabeum (strain ATCC 11539 / FP-39264 / Madison 617) TaxID=670483 RepID=S7S4S3_GLOTA|nr:copper transporter [Gloeophyllum trabeum ATCC 11539]EPQ60924.1 copper transporter [Gloeophyllum trabeum ATCC 11539]